MDHSIIRDLIKRIEKLEKAVFSAKPRENTSKRRSEFTGPKGGVLKLIAEEFFKKRKTATETKSEMETYDYHYSIQAIQMALKRLSNKDGPLVSFVESGKKVYVERK